MKTLIYISPQFPENFAQFALRFADKGGKLLGISSDHYESLPQALKKALTDYRQIFDVNDSHQIITAAKELAAIHGTPDFVESHSEFWLPAEAQIREALGIPGMGSEETAMLQKKSLMKGLFRKAGIKVAEGKRVSSKQALLEFASHFNFPVLVKPDKGVGAQNITVLRTRAALEAFEVTEDLFAEQYLFGKIVTFDGLVDLEGNIIFQSALEYSSGIAEVVNNRDSVHYYTYTLLPKDLIDQGQRLVHLLPLRGKFFHIEFFRSDTDGCLYGLEINARPPGGYTVDMWNYADDIDLYAIWAEVLLNGSAEVPYKRKQHVCYASRKYHHTYTHSQQQVLEHLGDRLRYEVPISPLFSGALGDHGFIFIGSSVVEIGKSAAYIRECV